MIEPVAINNPLGTNNVAELVRRYGPVPAVHPIHVPHIDFSKDNIVVWVPGTSMHHMPEALRHQLIRQFGPTASLATLNYLANWKFTESMPNGMETLKATLDLIKRKKRPGAKVYLIGLSQGALLISDLLTNPIYNSMITKVALMGHPGIAGSHAHLLGASKVKEYNNFMDPATLEWRGDSVRIIKSIDNFMRGNVLGALYLLKVAVHNPAYVGALAVLGMKKLPFYSQVTRLPDPHDYTNQYADAVSWLTQK